MKKEEELKKTLDEKDKWYKEQLESLQNRVRLLLREKKKKLMQHSRVAGDTEMSLCCFVHR